MGLNQIHDPEVYIRFMRENPKEPQALFRELLIGVTSFFRDAASFETLKQTILPGLFAQMGDDATFRVWIPGCSTGEEVYSLSMILRECLDAVSKRVTLQLFGTDIDKVAIDKAREGIFPESIAADVSLERLNRFFIKEGQFFRIRNEIRDTVVFSVQDVLKDPPFSRLNLLCCRNLLIYLDTRAQKKLLPLFHYTLMPGGILVLGSSESIGEFTNLFHPLDTKWKIFKRREVPQGLLQPVEFPSGLSKPDPFSEATPTMGPQKGADIGRMAQKVILDRFSPSAVLVDAKGTILHVVGRTGKYLEPPSGSPTLNVLEKGFDFQNVSCEIDQPEGVKRFVVHGQNMGQEPDLTIRMLLHFEEDLAEGRKDAK
jgi:two-component system CheB/CheR fusion protein